MVKLLLIPILYGGLYDDRVIHAPVGSFCLSGRTVVVARGAALSPTVGAIVTCANRISKGFPSDMVCITSTPMGRLAFFVELGWKPETADNAVQESESGAAATPTDVTPKGQPGQPYQKKSLFVENLAGLSIEAPR